MTPWGAAPGPSAIRSDLPLRGSRWPSLPADCAVNQTVPTAEGETGHAHGHLEYLEEVGDTATGKPIGATEDNLRAAIAGKRTNTPICIQEMARTAREEGFEEIAEWFETLAKAEKSHAGRFRKALDAL